MYQKIKQYLKFYLEQNAPKLLMLIRKYKIGIKYIISGGSTAVVLFSLLYLLTDILGLWYIYSTIISFVIALIINFVLQKFWTFRDNDLRKVKKQLAMFIFIGGINFVLNPFLLYILVERFHIWYMLGEAIVVGSLAIMNFTVNKFIIFKKERIYESINDKHRQ